MNSIKAEPTAEVDGPAFSLVAASSQPRPARNLAVPFDGQFAKVVRQLESVPPKQAKQIMLNLIGTGRADQAVAYLDAMSARPAAKLLREFKTDRETELATELLEQLRTFGVEAEVAELPGDDDSLSTAR